MCKDAESSIRISRHFSNQQYILAQHHLPDDQSEAFGAAQEQQTLHNTGASQLQAAFSTALVEAGTERRRNRAATQAHLPHVSGMDDAGLLQLDP